MKFNCKNCNIECEKKDKKSVFCSKSCSAIWNNKKRFRKNVGSEICIHCKKPTNWHSKQYCSIKCFNDHKRINNIQAGTASPRSIKKYLLDNNNICSICGISPQWENKYLMFVLDHIDGNPNNNHISNLRLVCPNCDSQLPTFKSRNRGNGRHNRKIRYQNNQSY